MRRGRKQKPLEMFKQFGFYGVAQPWEEGAVWHGPYPEAVHALEAVREFFWAGQSNSSRLASQILRRHRGERRSEANCERASYLRRHN